MHDLARSNDAVHSAFRTVHDDIGVSVANWKSPGKGYIVVSNLFGVRWGGMDWGEREKTLRGGAPPTAPLPEKGSTTKKNMNACRKGTMVHAVFIVYAAGWHSCQPTGGRISQLPSRSIFGITTKTCTTRRFSHDHHASTMTIWNVSQSLSPASLGQRFSLWGVGRP